jgi:pimeloyl-ACP methyl ester carboxylesterase
MSTIKVNDLTVNYEISGEGTPLLLLPGLLGSIESDWRRFIPLLSRDYLTVAVDLRGHGLTDNPARPGQNGTGRLEMAQLIDDLNGLLDVLGYEKVAILGYSLGGCLGLLAGLQQPGRVKALIMHATKFFWDGDAVESMAAGLNPAELESRYPCQAQNLQFYHCRVYGQDYWKTLMQTAAEFVRTMPQTAPAIEQAAQADFPILISVGSRDTLVTVPEALRLYQALPHSELLVLPFARHPINSINLDTFLPVIQQFLNRVEK